MNRDPQTLRASHRWHRILLALGCLWSLSVGCTAQPVVAEKDGLRVATYNIEWFSEDANPGRIANLKSVLNNVQPDIIGLQEIQSRKALNQIFDDKWEIGMMDEASEDQEVAIAVRKPLKLEEVGMVFDDPIFDFSFPGRRDVLRAVVVSPDGARHSFYVNHMKSRSGGRRQTDPQREMAAGLLAAFIKGKAEENVVVLGDLNDAPDDRSVNILETGNLMASAGSASAANPLLVNLMDPLARSNHVSHGLFRLFSGDPIEPVVPEAWSENERTRGIDYRYPDDLKVTQILFDQILVSPSLAKVAGKASIYSGADALRGEKGQTRRTDTGTDYIEKGTLSSDHLLVYVDLKLPAN